MRTLLTALAFILICGHPAFAQQPAPAAQPLRVFLDCGPCDFDFLRTEITYVDYVRDRSVADVHVLVTTQRNSSGGEDFQIDYIGLRDRAGQTRTLRYSSSGTNTSDERRRGFARTFALGLVPFLYGSETADRLRIEYDVPIELQNMPPTTSSAATDPWNLWIFRAGMSVNVDGERANTGSGIRGNFSANRTTDLWKLSLSANGNYNQNTFTLSDGREISRFSRQWQARTLAVRSLGGQHWAAAARASAGSSTFENRDLALRSAAGIEYSFFPYSESTRRALYAQYSVGINRLTYDEVTIFDKLEETLYDQNFQATLALRQPWGFSRLSVEAASYLHDVSLHRMEIEGRIDVRLFRGFSLNVNGNASRVRDQIYLPKGAASDEEILLRLRRLQSGYRYGLSVGFNYQFGSIFNNVVNPRFEGF
ncbi:MAG TPA: hypothetical protein VMN81_14320 [Vicinamibacterales bacterium]|nr:hypothetical protein [Vicinamibacterales bacterium]